MYPHFQKYLNPQVRTNKLVNSVFYHPCPSRLASVIHPFIFLWTPSSFISPENAYLIFSDLYIPTCVGKIFQFMMLTFLENVLNLCILTHAPVPISKFLVEFFENFFPLPLPSPQDGKGGGSYDWLYQNSVKKYEDDLKH